MQARAMGAAILVAALTAAAGAQRLVELDLDVADARQAAMRAEWSDGESWRARADRVRHHLASVLDLPGLGPGGVEPDPSARGPLDPVVHEARVYEDYIVEDISFRSFEGSRVSGNLYRPIQSRGLHAAILCPHGHFGASDNDPEGRFRRDMQIRCATLARMGAVVFAYDMVGWGESDIADHHAPEALPLQTYNSIRAVDYLVSRADIDPSRVGVTGASGGGTQSFLLAALDRRIAASAPVVMVSAHFFGGCMCESGLPLHSGEGLSTNNVEIAALAAPRPLLLVSCGADWTRRTPTVEFPYARAVYAALGSEQLVANAHLADEVHDYGPSKRAAVYAFFAKHLGLDPLGETGELPVEIAARSSLLASSDGSIESRRRSARDALAALRSR